ncbi:MAG: hypothetical protein JWP28_2959 [Phenylobacterium sp.]|jgi:hypothetical protein|uniref:hypothetical protein n=1 Tax=Phenylobacterium sp. TaxID=1871053 RepID=UPI00260E66D3|nr:hypothetical protein [Phenylobacterium sp.]MDB5498928.1 hypothetical protein [Phenylobacterium sp.]
MRTALASLILTVAVASAAQAQTPAAPAPAPATQPASPPTTAAPSTPAPSTAAPPAATPETPAPAAEAPPTLPTTGDGAVLLNVVEKVCVPLVRGGKLDDLAKANGFKLNRREGTWTMPLGGDKNYTVTIFPSGVNKDACRGEVHYAIGQEKPIVSAFNVWSFLHQPELILQANYVSVNADGVKRVQKSWEHLDSASSTAVNFTTWTKPDDTPLNPRFATGEVYYQERHFQ